MSTVPENVLADVGRELAGLRAEASPPAAPTGSLGELLKRYTDLENEVRAHKERLEELAPQLTALQAALLESYAESGIQRATANGLTVYVRNDFFASKRAEVSTETICETLHKCGCGYLVKEGYNANSLRAKIKEWLAEGVEVPAELAGLLNVGEVPRIVAVKA